METRQIIQNSANVVRITHLKKGDVYKRIDEATYGGPSIYYGVVIELLNDGTKTFIETLEYKKDYGQVTAEVKVFAGDNDVSIYPASPDEVRHYLSDAIEGMHRRVKEKQEELNKLKEAAENAEAFVSGETAKQLFAPEYESLAQMDYDAKKQLEQSMK